jgi:anti-sigma regulatory factor (Ser/Thr protein kinase)
MSILDLSGAVTRSNAAEFASYPAAVTEARGLVRCILSSWKLEHLADSAESVVAELVANSVTATQEAGLDTPVRLTLLAGSESVLVVVWDGVADPPARSDAGDDAEHGRGLLLVEAFSAEWNWTLIPPEHGGGKIVRAVIDA